DIRIELNDGTSSESNLSKAVERRKDAGVGESLEDAFTRILSMKNSDPDRQRILAVRKAMEDGYVGREQAPMEKGKKLTKAEVLRIYKRVEEREKERTLEEMKRSKPDNYVLVDDKNTFERMIRSFDGEMVYQSTLRVRERTCGRMRL